MSDNNYRQGQPGAQLPGYGQAEQGGGPGYGQGKRKAKAKDGGIHYHYHFYGAGSVPPQGGQEQAGQPQGYAPQQGPGGGAPWPGGPGFGPGMAATGWAFGQTPYNRHAHPRADSLVKGLAVGAGVAWLATNETVQRTVLRTAFQLWAAVQGGMAEFKERMRDAEAEAEAAAEAARPVEPEEPEMSEPPASPQGKGPRPISS